jgi:hypothetical protein
MPHAQTACCRRAPSGAVLHRAPAPHPGPLPAAGELIRGAPRLLQPQGQRGGRTSPGCEGLTHGAGARPSRHHIQPVLQPHSQGAATGGLPSGHEPTPPLQAPGQPRLTRQGRVPTLAAMALPHAAPQGEAAIPTHAAPAPPWLEVVTPVLALPVGRPRRPRPLRGGLIDPREGQRGGILRQPGRREGLALQGCERARTHHRVEMGRQQGIEERPAAGLMEGGPRASRLHQRHPATLLQASPALGEGLRPSQKRAP